jgi:hypothetical protein
MSVLRDIKLAFRLFLRAPALTGIALVSIALSPGELVLIRCPPFARSSQGAEMLAMEHPADGEFVIERSIVSKKLLLQGIGYLRPF